MSRKSLVFFALGLIALALYTAGIHSGVVAVFVLAVVVETWFWIKVFKLRSKRNPNQ